MKTLLFLVIFIFSCPFGYAGGSIAWEEVRASISKSDPELIKCIETNFTVDRGGMGVRLGNQFGERVGERIPPYDFDAILKKSGEKFHLEIVESDDFEFTKRYKFSWQIITTK